MELKAGLNANEIRGEVPSQEPTTLLESELSPLRHFLFLPLALGYFVFSLVQLVYLLLIPRKSFDAYFEQIEGKEQNARVEALRKWLRPGWEVLDVGSGSGRFGACLAHETRVRVSGVDVVDYDGAVIPFKKYDGKTLPFEDKSFDVVLVAFVLHHCRDQERVLKELTRVARERVVIFEDTYQRPWEKPFVAWNDYCSNILQGLVRVWRGHAKSGILAMPMPFKFHTIPQWEKILERHGLALRASRARHLKHKPMSKVLLVADVKTGV
jgi:ubiquinone/menaquinone biosynthesis C-methylase UbiE